MNTSLFKRIVAQEDLNFLLTNRVPRIALTHFIGWYSQIRSPLLARLSIAVWRWFTDLDLSESPPQRYGSLHACFTRPIRPETRPIDADPVGLCSPCDAIVGASGVVEGSRVFQAKGFPYTLDELFGPGQDTTPYRDGVFVTLRLTSAMYHRFHAPQDLAVEHVTYLSGDTWNVNPIALKRVERLFCRNERAVLNARLSHSGTPVAIVPVAAILVASLRLHFLDLLLHLRYRGPNEIPVQPPATFRKGDEMGWFQHGSTILVFAPPGWQLADGVADGQRIRMGRPLLVPKQVPMKVPQP